ncbi:MAG TPA: protein translocase subunit SecD [Candidatus Paceibacterota bacterium]|nr:protein translocase subunit SecD [Candidatus Paceibacterota bacterium]
MKSALSRILPAVLVLILAALLAWFVLSTNTPGNRYAVKLGLDLAGGTELVYRADTSTLAADKKGALDSLRDIIDRRVNLFGVAEPVVQLEQGSAVAGNPEDRLIVELPGVTDVKAAVDAIGATPVLEFKLASSTAGTSTELFTTTGLTGRYLKNSELQFSSGTTGGTAANEPVILLNFNEEGAKLFEEITREHTGEILAIFLDGEVISAPVIREAIPGGIATITGQFTPLEARDLVQNLNFGALPVPIELVSSGSVGPTLGGAALDAGLLAAMIGFAFVALFMILWYRLPGFVASVALVIYVLINLAIIKFIPVTLTASGIAGLILSIGMAVDANVLIFERMKEELRAGKTVREALTIGFGRAWPAIRDGHLTMIISSIILFWLGTSIVQGFALVFGFGVIVSLISAVFITRIFLLALLPEDMKGNSRMLLGSGFRLKP